VIVSGDNITAATRGFFILDDLGHPRVSLLDGGYVAWQADGLPVSTLMETPLPGSMVTPTRSDRSVTVDGVFATLWNEDVTLLDARCSSGNHSWSLRTTGIPARSRDGRHWDGRRKDEPLPSCSRREGR
jgi:3-mercaptopyruvate sulfurtransferase SseA